MTTEATLTSPIDPPSRVVTSTCIETPSGTSLAVQRLRLCTPKAGGPGSQVTEQLSPCTASEPACCNYWRARRLKPVLLDKRHDGRRSPRTTAQSSPRPPQLEKSWPSSKDPVQTRDPVQTKIKEKKIFLKTLQTVLRHYHLITNGALRLVMSSHFCM